MLTARRTAAAALLVGSVVLSPLARWMAGGAEEYAAAAPSDRAAPVRLVHTEPHAQIARLHGLASPTAGTAIPTQNVQLSEAEELENGILNELNAARRAHGLRPLKLSSALARAADDHVHVLAVAGQFRHEWPDGRAFSVWIRRYYPVRGARYWSVGENLFWTSGGLEAAQAANAWLASPPHRRVLLTRSWRQIGIGVVRALGAGGVYGGADVYITAADFGVRS